LKVTSNAFNRLVLQSADSLTLPLTFGSFWLSLTLLLEPLYSGLHFRHFIAVVSLSLLGGAVRVIVVSHLILKQTYGEISKLPNFLTLF
jgi:hypothetical protein